MSEILVRAGELKTDDDRQKRRIAVGKLKPIMRGDAEDSVAAYFEDYVENNFSFLFVDGSMAQVEAHLVQDTIVWHRYCFIPAPFDVPDGIDAATLEEYISTLQMQTDNVRLRSRIRFDFSPDDADEVHPASHLTFMQPSCRIAVRNGLGIRSFLRFVTKHFVPNAIEKLDFTLLDHDCVAGPGPADPWSEELHVTWR